MNRQKLPSSSKVKKARKVSVCALLPPSDGSDEEKDVKMDHQQLPTSSKVSVCALVPPSDESNEESVDAKPKNSVKFGSIEVYKFGFAQGVDTVPSNGCVSLGMERHHHEKHTFTVDEYSLYKQAENKIKYQNWFFTSQKLEESLKEEKEKKERPPKKKRKIVADKALEQSTSNSEDEFGVSGEEYFEDCKVYEPLRKAILEESGVVIDQNVTLNTHSIHKSRVKCGCQCRGGKCLPNKCECARHGIKCQVENVDYISETSPTMGYPCRCTAKSCKNPEGRTELNLLRIRTHFHQTMMRLRDAKRRFGNASLYD
ncbi:hypothetical protein ACQ4LE_008671 [Meloidogyne hapla]